ncbi:MAG TPA: basic secretory protein-like protein [Candidatus Acidoferrum sp.]|nr:basic secretory protein-like protein [Candidatus Acidoferrum sp.]
MGCTRVRSLNLTATKAAGLALAFLSACSTPRTNQPAAASVRKVDCSAAPNLGPIAERARQTANQYYPSLCALLADGECDFPPQVDICFKRRLPHAHSGEARLTQVCLNLEYLEAYKDPATLDYLLVHELTHVAQHYTRPVMGGFLMYTPNAPSCWQEGIADYVCFKLGLSNVWECAECSSLFPHYRNGYACAGAFLLYAETTYNPNLVRQLNTALRHGRYSDAFFQEVTREDLPALWAEFQQTRAFSPGATRVVALQQTLGFKNGKPPKDVERRLKSYLERQVDPGTRRLIKYASLPVSHAGDLQTRLALVIYFTQPGGSAEAYVSALHDRDTLPGFSKDQHGQLTGVLSPRNLDLAFPAERSFTARKQGDPSTYHYTLSCPDAGSSWRLQRAWRTDAEGHTVEEFGLQ